ncbi:MAG: DUF4188 domain-containing protein [Acidimicrobiia bacterium]
MERPNRVPRAYAGAADHAPKGVSGGMYCAELTGEEITVFLVGMRVNRWRKLRSWVPAFASMPKMLRELSNDPSQGFLGGRTFASGRVFLVVQYWRSVEDVGRYARSEAFSHLPMWRSFNGSTARTGDVGVFHETYSMRADQVETLYGNMPVFGLAAAQRHVPRGTHRRSATVERMGQQEPEYVDATS